MSSIDERVLTRIASRCESEYISRVRARYGLSYLSAKEFDEILTRNNISTYIDPWTRGQCYHALEVHEALRRVKEDCQLDA